LVIIAIPRLFSCPIVSSKVLERNKDVLSLLGRALFKVNVTAVVHRYGPAEPARSLDYEFHPELPGGDARVYQALCCLLYQCCEGDIATTKLFQALTTIRLKIAHGIIAQTVEYQRAEWE
jgi:hypothetical protein